MNIVLGRMRMMISPIMKLIDKELPVLVAWKLKKIYKELDKNIQEVEEFRIELVKKYGIEREGDWQVLDENVDKFTEEFEKLLNQDIELNIDTIDMEELGNIDLTTRDLILLDGIIK